jgi:hypothetical protein
MKLTLETLKTVYYVPGTKCLLCLGIDRDSSRRLLGRGIAMSGDAARKSACATSPAAECCGQEERSRFTDQVQ